MTTRGECFLKKKRSVVDALWPTVTLNDSVNKRAKIWISGLGLVQSRNGSIIGPCESYRSWVQSSKRWSMINKISA
uniref:Peptidase S1 domain-containing protein n=1 Tax=Panagrellus redivivus TaxID=6233 RepID=A0A7E4UNM8_PANRE